MPASSRDVKEAVSATRLPPLIERLQHAQLIKQGAEAKVYKATLYPVPIVTYPSSSYNSSRREDEPSTSTTRPQPVLLKHRFSKQYRHPTLDTLLTKQRLTSEVRALARCLKAGVTVPGLRVVDLKQGIVGMEWIEGWSVREVLGGGQDGDELPDDKETTSLETEHDDHAKTLEGENRRMEELMAMLENRGVDRDIMLATIGAAIAKMHLADIIHGDLTTSNMMLRLVEPITPNDLSFEVATSPMSEDRAVDLYVLERAFASTHPVPKLPSGGEGVPLFDTVLEGYRRAMEELGKKGDWARVEKRLDEVRMRGRKRSMVG
ncbi:serine/threonine-protein kinase bud32 [Microbotryomycetes sp. JL221]|nr:serine/threonine-protein kinase bud32 [Microbotryomycetes sp. JL221]